MADEVTDREELPATPTRFAEEQPAVWEAYSDLGKACAEAGPLDEETKRLVKLALAVGAQSEGAVHSHVRRGLDEGLDAAALQHVATLAVPTLGFPKAMAARSWIGDVTDAE
ncbi:carboxymuconolactone decarboxylase family protein [Haloarcula salina]|uniref:Carboxymuconolactone decarboxylase family protein n=1 Tax=Haloarcula salina TaxID=1429914 RepID=A0AA41KFH4_9EURY|nr:carboxymuconolactone decarboxylase family protein [Haloarcula salina]MBV0902052.1 carboxymuconolactone decarboxylase family protein [Haloarcula salina]